MDLTAFSDAPTVIAKVKTLINAQLKSILKRQGLAVSGVKAAMQRRIIAQIEDYVRSGNTEAYNRIRIVVLMPDGPPLSTPAPSTSLQNRAFSSLAHQNASAPNGLPRLEPSLVSDLSSKPCGAARLVFRDSPFYTIVKPLTPIMECKVRETTRDEEKCTIVLTAEISARLKKENDLKAMIYCAADPISHFTKADISFPHQIEIKINQEEVKSNLKGLKNKTGTTRPADITKLLHKGEGYQNLMAVTYALTQKKFYLVVNLVRQHPAETLVEKLKSGKSISKDRVISEMISKAQDSDLVATSSIMSLKCPLSTLRINVPCRSTVCTHNQCFDGLSFLQLQEQAPTWTCPVCNKLISFEALEVDEYVDDILKSTPKSVNQVTVEPDGRWFHESDNDRPGTGDPRNCGDEELVELKDIPRLSEIRDSPASLGRFSPASPTNRLASPSGGMPGSGKRPISQVVDLTCSSDEENDSLRQPKRQATQSAMHNLAKFPSMENVRSRWNGINSGNPKQFHGRPFSASSSRTANYANPV